MTILKNVAWVGKELGFVHVFWDALLSPENVDGSFDLNFLMQLLLGWFHSYLLYWVPSQSLAGDSGPIRLQ